MEVLVTLTHHMSPPTFFMTTSEEKLSRGKPWLSALMAFPLRVLAKIFYRLRVEGIDQMPAGGALILSNHISYIDVIILQIASPRPLRFIAFEELAKKWWIKLTFDAFGVITIAPRRSTEGIRAAVRAMQEGEWVCIFPEGQISRTGLLIGFKKGFELMARRAGVPVVPVFVDRLWGSLFSFSGHRYFWKLPEQLPYHVTVMVGRPLTPDETNAVTARQALLDLGEKAYSARPELKRHLARECVRGLAKSPGRVAIVDRTAERREVKAAMILAVASALSRRLRTTVAVRRVGIALPPGAGAAIANLAVSFAGKVPVNLNFTAGRAAVETALRVGEIDTILTADAVRNKFPAFPWPERTLDLKTEIGACGKAAMFKWLVAAWILPGNWIANLLDIPLEGDRTEAGLLFTSGSSGEPKGVVLTHRNLMANTTQFWSLNLIKKDDVMLGCLPIFHSFGFTVTMWFPLIRGIRLVTITSPLETRKMVDAIHDERVSVMIGAPTFLRPLLKKADRHELAPLRLVVSGAEKMPMDLFTGFKESFGIEIMQGYGLTETSPASNVNLPDPPRTTSAAEYQPGHRLGSVGRLFMGMTARIADPETGEPRALTETGMLWLRGPNVFEGYLKDPERTEAALKDGWFITGDLGRFDEDGFMYIEGRLSRFSKIGGEMVPHVTIENKIIQLFGWEGADKAPVVIVGVPDAIKGEALVMITTEDVSLEAVREKLSAEGLPNLWIPKNIKRVEAIPQLSTGKLDIQACRALAAAS